MKNKKTVEYVWLDGSHGMPQLRSKTRVLNSYEDTVDEWSFDGGSTNQASLDNSDTILKPVRAYRDPFRQHMESGLVLCEVMTADGQPHPSNSRSSLESITKSEEVQDSHPWFGFEQEYTLLYKSSSQHFRGGVPGQAYCGVGRGNVKGRALAEVHLEMCLYAGIGVHGINAEVMYGQWEFQTEALDPLRACDDLWMARYILQRLTENEENPYQVTYNPKPSATENGAGCHTNFSTIDMRKDNGIVSIHDAIDKLSKHHARHMSVYGEGNQSRMTGDCETSDYNKFSSGESHRGCSVRIPNHVAKKGCGYLEDRRPAANCDPYEVASVILETTCLENAYSN